MSEYVFDLSSFESDNIDDGLREEIVRCRDCEHFMRGNLCSRQDEWNEFHWLDVEPNGFCAWAKRKEGGDGLDAS